MPPIPESLSNAVSAATSKRSSLSTRGPCDRFTPHMFLSNDRCRDCDFPIEDHSHIASPKHANSSSFQQKVEAVLKAECTRYTPHQWLFDRCRDCGQPEREHPDLSVQVEELANNNKPSRPTPQHMRIRPSLRSNRDADKPQHPVITPYTDAQIDAAGRSDHLKVDSDDEDVVVSPASPHFAKLTSAQRTMDLAVARMVAAEQEYDDIRNNAMEKVQENKITEVEFNAKMEELQAAFKKKEEELKNEVETAQKTIAETEERLRLEMEEDRRRQVEREEEIATAARSAAEKEIAAAREEIEKTKQAAQEEIMRAREEGLRLAAEERVREDADRAARVADAEARAEAAKQAAEEARMEAEIMKQAAAEAISKQKEEMEEKTNTYQPVDDDEVQPTTAQPSSQPIGPYAGTVNLNEVLLKVEKVLMQGRNIFRATATHDKPLLSSIFLRIIHDEYVLCWSRADRRNVHPTRQIPFSALKSITMGKQTSVFKRSCFSDASQNCCISFIGTDRSLHIQAASERDAEMIAFGIASLMKEARLPVSVFDFGQYQDTDDALSTEMGQEKNEESDGSVETSFGNAEVLTRSTSTKRFNIELAVKCTSLPPVGYHYIVCLVNRDVKTDRLLFVSQTERVPKNLNPTFQKTFTVEYEENEESAGKQLRFNVYAVSETCKTIEDDSRIGSVQASVKSLADNEQIFMVYPLSHRDPKRNTQLQKSGSWIHVQCLRKVEIDQKQSTQTPKNIGKEEALKAQELLIKGNMFTNYDSSSLASNAGQSCTVFYRLESSADAANKNSLLPSDGDKFTLGHLHCTYISSTKPFTISMPIRTLSDVYVGKKHRVFTLNAKDEACLSLVNKNGMRFDLEARDKAQRDEWVTSITTLLKYAAQTARERAQNRLGTLKRAPAQATA